MSLPGGRTHIRVPLLATLVIAIICAVGACGPAYVIVIVNRSDATIAFLPGVVVGPCSEVGFTAAQIKTAQDAFGTADDRSWIPEGALWYTDGVPGQRIGAPKPQTIIFSGSAAPQAVDGSVPADALPECGGEPIGID